MTPPPRGHRAGTVALIGRTNVGKSTLINQLVLEKVAIVSEVPQTTRGRITGVRNLPGAQIALVDTPGIHRPRHRMNRMMVDAALEAARRCDVIAFIVDAAVGIGPGDRAIAKSLLPRRGAKPIILVLNKVDRMRKPDLLPMLDRVARDWGFDEVVPVSALSGENCDRLLAVIVPRLPEGPPLFPDDTFTDQPGRRIVSEFIREKILHRARQELPHETAVLVDRWHERDDGLCEIDATIACERDSQKAILIGRGGSFLKEVGTAARLEAESLFGMRIMLRLRVKVKEGWRENEAALREMGIGE